MPELAPHPDRESSRSHMLKAVRDLLQRLRRWAAPAGRQPNHVVVRISGEITAKKAERIERDVRLALRTKPRVLEVDLSRVAYLGGNGGRFFLTALRAAEPAGTRVIVTHAGPQVRSALARLGLEPLLDIHEGAAPRRERGGG